MTTPTGPLCRACKATEARCAYLDCSCCSSCSHFGWMDAAGDEMTKPVARQRTAGEPHPLTRRRASVLGMVSDLRPDLHDGHRGRHEAAGVVGNPTVGEPPSAAHPAGLGARWLPRAECVAKVISALR